MAILNRHKAELGLLLARGHAKFGKVAPRRPYRDDDDSGEGGAALNVETHPMLANLPVGAASDLTFIASENSNITEEALERFDELTPELKNQPSLQPEYQPTHRSTPKLTRG